MALRLRSSAYSLPNVSVSAVSDWLTAPLDGRRRGTSPDGLLRQSHFLQQFAVTRVFAADASLDVRLIYGEFLPFLMSIDSSWMKQNVEQIFPREPALRLLKDVAWVAYLTANR